MANAGGHSISRMSNFLELQLLTPRQVEGYLRLSPNSLRELVRSGALAEIRLTADLPRYRLTDVVSLVARGSGGKYTPQDLLAGPESCETTISKLVHSESANSEVAS